MARIAITGCAGYIGLPLAKRIAKTEKLIGIDRANMPSDWPAGAKYHQIDLAAQNPKALTSALQGVDTIFHLAAARTDWGLSEEGYEKDNVHATRAVIASGKTNQIKHWIYFSTVGVLGPSERDLDEKAQYAPNTAYGRTKTVAEQEMIDFARSEKRCLKVLRPSAVFSENQPDNTNIHRLIQALRTGRYLGIGKGNEIKTTSYLHNVVEAAIWLYECRQSKQIEIYNYVDEPRLTTKKIVSVIAEKLKVKEPKIRIPLAMVLPPAYLLDFSAKVLNRDLPITASRIRKFCTATNFDSTKIRKQGFVAPFDTIAALNRTVESYL